MTFSKKNLDKLKSFLEKNESSNKKEFKSISHNKKLEKIQANSNKYQDYNKLFYSTIDNSNDIKDTTNINNYLKKSEDNLFKLNKFTQESNSNQISRRDNANYFSEEELLYEEFNFLLDE